MVRKADNTIIAGHTRVLACKQLGLEKVPAIYLDLDEVNSKIYAVFDNKSVELAGWDGLKLADVFVMLDETNQDLGLTGFSEDEVQQYVLGPTGLDTQFTLPGGDKANLCQITFTLTNDQRAIVEKALVTALGDDAAIEQVQKDSGNPNKNGCAMAIICSLYVLNSEGVDDAK